MSRIRECILVKTLENSISQRERVAKAEQEELKLISFHGYTEITTIYRETLGFSGVSDDKESSCNAEDLV